MNGRVNGGANGTRIGLRPVAGTEPEPVVLFRASELGPCRATVVADVFQLASGRWCFRVTECWTPPVAGAGAVLEVTILPDNGAGAFAAARLAGETAEAWRQGSARSEELAPGGRLRAG